MNRNVRQCCPISALLYLFVLDILAFELNHNSEIKIINISNMIDDIKFIQNADDINLTLNDICNKDC